MMILTVTNLGQTRLKESQQRELALKVDSYSGLLEYFFTQSQEEMVYLAEGRTMQTFFANLASGMSMKYGLGASLINLENELKSVSQSKLINRHPIYTRLKVIGYRGKVIADTHPEAANTFDLALYKERQPHHVHVFKQPNSDQLQIQLIEPILFSGKQVGYLVADVNRQIIIDQLTAQEYDESRSRMILQSQAGSLYIWDNLSIDIHSQTANCISKARFKTPHSNYKVGLSQSTKKIFSLPLGSLLAYPS